MAKINKQQMREHVNRLVSLPGKDVLKYGDEDSMAQTVRDELGRAIERHAKDAAHAQRIVDALMAGQFRPVPAEVQRAAEETNREVLPESCGICHGLPWITVEIPARDLNGTRITLASSKRCTCARGQWLAAKDREQSAKGPA